MKMRKNFLVLMVILCPGILFAQQFSLKGKIVDPLNVPVEFASVSLLMNDSVFAKQVEVDSLGSFFIEAEKGNYRLVVKQFGRELLNREIQLDSDLQLGKIEIDNASDLYEVTVTTRKKLIEQKVDRLVFNVENSTAATGGTALDALKATPTVRVQNDYISIVGKGQVLVMIDDRLQKIPQEDLANFLKSIPADHIKSIEVITTPPAWYDAEGNNGLINIRLKTTKSGTWNASIGGSYIQRTYASGNLQGLFNYNHRKLAVRVSLNKGQENLLTSLESYIYYTEDVWKQAIKNRSVSNLFSMGLDIDYKLTQKWTTGIKYLGSFTDQQATNDPFTTRWDHLMHTAHSYIDATASTKYKTDMNTLNWYHSFALDSSGKSIAVDVDYFQYRKKDYRLFSGNELDKNREILPGTFFSSVNTNINRAENYSGKIDVSLPYQWADISFGGKLSSTITHNDLEVYDDHNGLFILNTDQSNVFEYTEANQALYLSVSKKINRKWETQAGLRMEATQTEGSVENTGQTDRNRYLRVFPTAYLTYNVNDKHTFSLNYSRRIRRPDFNYLNPFIVRTSPYFYSEGNPFLKPSFIDNLEYSYICNQKWVSSVYYSQVSNFSQELAIVDASTNITRMIPLNYANTFQLGFSTYYNFNKWSWWTSFTGFNVNYQHVKSKTDIVKSTAGYNGYFYTNNDFTLNRAKTILFGLNYALQLPGRYQIFHISTMHIFDASVKFLLLDKKLSLTLAAEDLLNGQRPLITYYSNGIRNSVKSYGDTRAFRISVSYRFGNKGLKANQRSTGNEDEKNRVG